MKAGEEIQSGRNFSRGTNQGRVRVAERCFDFPQRPSRFMGMDMGCLAAKHSYIAQRSETE